MPIIAPSLLSADFLNLERDCKMLDESEADWFHLDVMDGRFVPNISYGMPIIKQMRKTTKKVFDVHLMIVEPEKYLEAFKDAGADILTVHWEASLHLHRTLQQIKQLGMKAGVSLNPHTPVSVLEDVLADIDLVLIMSVNPGFGGQKFIPQTINKVAALKNMIQKGGFKTLIEVDGGVTVENAADLVAAGADALVAGNTVFASKDPCETIRQLKGVK